MKNFIERWKNKGDEKSDTQTFWLEFLHDVLGVENPGPVIEFEKRVKIEQKNFIDVYIPSTRVLIEQKSFDVDLDKPAKQSDDEILTPFEQAKRYSDWLPDSQHARWIITCNFQEFHVHDMDSFDLNAPPEIIKLENLEEEARKFQILIDPKAISPKEIREEKISIEGGKLVKKLKESLKPRYRHCDDEEILKRQHRDLTIFCVRIVFLLYAEDSGLLKKNQFYDYLKLREITARDALIELFDVLSTKEEERDFYLEEVNDFAVAVARTALWIVDNQMWKETQEITKEDPLPLKEYDNIKEGSAMDTLDTLEGFAWGLPGWKIYH